MPTASYDQEETGSSPFCIISMDFYTKALRMTTRQKKNWVFSDKQQHRW